MRSSACQGRDSMRIRRAGRQASAISLHTHRMPGHVPVSTRHGVRRDPEGRRLPATRRLTSNARPASFRSANFRLGPFANAEECWYRAAREPQVIEPRTSATGNESRVSRATLPGRHGRKALTVELNSSTTELVGGGMKIETAQSVARSRTKIQIASDGCRRYDRAAGYGKIDGDLRTAHRRP